MKKCDRHYTDSGFGGGSAGRPGYVPSLTNYRESLRIYTREPLDRLDCGNSLCYAHEVLNRYLQWEIPKQWGRLWKNTISIAALSVYTGRVREFLAWLDRADVVNFKFTFLVHDQDTVAGYMMARVLSTWFFIIRSCLDEDVPLPNYFDVDIRMYGKLHHRRHTCSIAEGLPTFDTVNFLSGICRSHNDVGGMTKLIIATKYALDRVAGRSDTFSHKQFRRLITDTSKFFRQSEFFWDMDYVTRYLLLLGTYLVNEKVPLKKGEETPAQVVIE